MSQQFVFRMQNNESKKEQNFQQPEFKSRTLDYQRQMSSMNSGTMSLRTNQAQNVYDGDNMTSLHTKLHQEADKIRKWKVLTEMELKDKDKRLAAASTQLETMKKSMLELQLDNEKLSSKMEEEKDYRAELVQKISATRELCIILKSTASRLEDRVFHCETEKTELKYSWRDTSQHLEELNSKFKNLTVTADEKQTKLLTIIDKERDESQEKIRILKNGFEQRGSLIHQMEKDLKEKCENVSELENTLLENNNKLQQLNESINQLESNNKSLQDDVDNKETAFKESALRILTIQDEKNVLEEKLENYERELRTLKETKDKLMMEIAESCTKYGNELTSAQEQINKLETDLQTEQQRKRNFETELQETLSNVEKLKSSRDILVLEKTELEMKMNISNMEIDNLKVEVSSGKQELNSLNGEINVLIKKLDREILCRNQIQETEKDLENKICTLRLERDEQSNIITELEKQLENEQKEMRTVMTKESKQVDEFNSRIESKEIEIQQQRTHIKSLETELSKLQELIVTKDKNIQTKETDIKKLQSQLEDQKSQTDKTQKKLQDVKSQCEKIQQSYEEEMQKTEELNDQLNNINLENKEHGKSLMSQQKKFSAQTKHNKELDKEVKLLKAKLNTEVLKSSENEKLMNNMQEEVEELKKSKEELIKKISVREREMKSLQEDCDRDKKATEEAMAKAKQMQMEAKKESDNAKALTECQLSDMMATLDSYKQSSEKMLAEKDTEVKNLKKKLEASTTSNKTEVDELKDENKRLSLDSTSLCKEKEDLNMKLTISKLENQTLKNKIQDLEKKLEDGSFVVHSSDYRKSQKPSLDSVRKTQITPVAPITPHKQVLCTPRSMKTPINTITGQTPRRSILKASSSIPKRRKVAFSSGDQDITYSSDDLMELEIEQVQNDVAEKYLPSSAIMRTPRTVSNIENITRLTPKMSAPLCKPLDTSTPKQKIVDPPLSSPHNAAIDKSWIKEPKRQETVKTPGNLRNVSVRKTSRFFTTSPKEKRTKIKDKAKKDSEQMSWFDLDSVYGFGAED